MKTVVTRRPTLKQIPKDFFSDIIKIIPVRRREIQEKIERGKMIKCR